MHLHLLTINPNLTNKLALFRSVIFSFLSENTHAHSKEIMLVVFKGLYYFWKTTDLVYSNDLHA